MAGVAPCSDGSAGAMTGPVVAVERAGSHPRAPPRLARFNMGRRRFRLRVGIMLGALTLFYLYGRFVTPAAPSTSGLRGGGEQHAVSAAPSEVEEYAAAMGRRLLQSRKNCSVIPEKADLSIIGNIVGSSRCDASVGAEDECVYCCTGFDNTVGVPVYFLIMLYMFLGLAIICDDYFCESLDAISEALNLSEDVAGATFMAAGSSAPELFTAIVTVLITGGSEGLGTIVGSAIFNIMIIVGVTAMFAGQELKVWWYPLSRDCCVYFLSIILMVWAIADKEVMWWEAAVLVVCYGGYIGLMVYNEAIVSRVKKLEAAWGKKKTTAKAKKALPVPKEPVGRRGSIEMRAQPVKDEDIVAAAKRLIRASQDQDSLTDDAKQAAREIAHPKSPSAPQAWNEGGAKTVPVAAASANTDSPASSSSRLLSKLGGGNSFRSSPKVAPSPSPDDPANAISNDDATADDAARKVTKISLDKSADSASTMAANGTPPPASAANRTVAALSGGNGAPRTNSNVSVSQVTAALKAPAPAPARTPARSGGMSSLAGAFGKPKGSASKYAAGKKEEEEKKVTNVLHKAEYRKVWGGNKNKKKARSNKRAERTVRVTMKVAVAASRFRAGLLRARSRNASPAGSPAGSPRAGAAANKAPPASKMLAALNRAAEKKPEPPKPKAKEEDDDEDEGCLDKFLEIIGWPLAKAMQFTVPPCAEDGWKKWYMVTFTMSILWIGVLSYVMVDMAGRAGCVLGIPGLVMGLVVLAAGTSVPDALSSILVAKLGQGDMAVANVLGSNVFNILLGLGLPWLARSLVDGHGVRLPEDEDIVLPVIVLLLYLAFFIGVIALQKWKLSKTLGVIFIVAHFVFLAWNLLTLLPDPIIKL